MEFINFIKNYSKKKKKIYMELNYLKIITIVNANKVYSFDLA